jgi:hypothetical protein
MKAKKRAMSEHDTKHVTPAGRSALLDLAASDEDAVELRPEREHPHRRVGTAVRQNVRWRALILLLEGGCS